MTDLVVIVPVLRRAHRVVPFVESLEAATSEPHRTIFVASANDRAMIEAVSAAAERWPTVSLEVIEPARVGDYAKKINHGYRVSREPFLFTAADDLAFHPSWYAEAVAEMQNPAIGVVGTQDLCNPRTIAGTHSTHLLFRRSYVDRFGTIDAPGRVLHEGYPHEFVDDEAVETAKYRGAWSFAAGSVVEHLHPMVGKAPRDAIYARQSDRMAAGRRVFRSRRHLWTPPAEPPTPATTAVIVATFGEELWAELAQRRAIPSALAELPGELIVEHGDSLHGARNAGAARATLPWLCFLDADDELEPGYLEAMRGHSGDLLAPSVRFVEDGAPEPAPVSLAGRDIRRTNPCVIGTLVRRSLFVDADGFWQERAWEDWSLFRRCWLLGGIIEHVPAATYRAYVDPSGRNSTVTNPAGLTRQITASHSEWHRRKRARQ